MLSFLLLGRSNKEGGNKERLTTDKRSQRNGGTNIVYKSFVTRRSRRKKTFAKTSRFFHYFRSIFVVEGSWRKREKNIQEIPIPVFASSSAGSLKPREERISRHRHYIHFIGWPRGKYLLVRRSEPPLDGGKGFLCSLYLLLPTSYASRRNPIRIYRLSRLGLYKLTPCCASYFS